jgi:hypothetical protein
MMLKEIHEKKTTQQRGGMTRPMANSMRYTKALNQRKISNMYQITQLQVYNQ